VTTNSTRSAHKPNCPSCFAERSLLLGPSVFVDWAENQLVAELRQKSGELFQCDNCHLVFRSPVPTRDELIAAYQAFPSESWDYVAPPRWAWMRKCIADLAPNRKVLDVGCFRGDFLTTIVGQYECYGIEPNQNAAETAKSRGIKIIGSEAMDELKGFEGFFGTIVLMDVAEHLPDPAVAFRHLAKYLAPKGILLVLTGNADHWLAKSSLPFYWYMSFPIHLVFLSDRYFKWFTRNDGWSIARRLYFSHQDHGLWRRFRHYELAFRFLIWRQLLNGNWAGSLLKKTRLFRNISDQRSPLLLFCLRDHIGVALVAQNK